MTTQEHSDGIKLMYFIAYVLVNVFSYYAISFCLDYAHNYINPLFIPKSLLWGENGQIKQDKTAWYTIQMIMVFFELISLAWLLYRVNQSNVKVWLATQSFLVARLTTLIVSILVLFSRGGFLLYIIKKIF